MLPPWFNSAARLVGVRNRARKSVSGRLGSGTSSEKYVGIGPRLHASLPLRIRLLEEVKMMVRVVVKPGQRSRFSMAAAPRPRLLQACPPP